MAGYSRTEDTVSEMKNLIDRLNSKLNTEQKMSKLEGKSAKILRQREEKYANVQMRTRTFAVLFRKLVCSSTLRPSWRTTSFPSDFGLNVISWRPFLTSLSNIGPLILILASYFFLSYFEFSLEVNLDGLFLKIFF